MPRRYYLYGPPGAGKSTVGRLVAQELELPLVDLDSVVEAGGGRTVGEIIRRDGEAVFRQREASALMGLPSEDEAVIALGGGTLLDAECRAFAERTGTVVCLTARSETLEHRLRTDGIDRPLLAGADGEGLRRLLAKRSGHYASFSHELDTSDLPPQDAARRAEIAFGPSAAFRGRIGVAVVTSNESPDPLNAALKLARETLDHLRFLFPLHLDSSAIENPGAAEAPGVRKGIL